MNGLPRRSAGRNLRRRAMSGVALAALFGAIAVWCTGGVAQAAVTTFTMTPDSGPPGTVVHVSGTGCTPGLLASIGTDFVTLTATTLNLAVRAPVAANGSWQTSFTVPASAAGPLPTPVAAVCVSSGIQSLLTIYTPQVFSVSAVATATSGTNPTPGGATSAAPPASDGGGSGTTPTSPDHPTDPKPTKGPGSTVAAPGGGSGGGGAAPGGSGTVTIGTAASVAAQHAARHDAPAPASASGKQQKVAAAAAAAATLQPADLGAGLAPATGGAGGLGWPAWLLLIALALAVVGVPAWLWHSRRNQLTPAGGEQP